MEKTFEEALEFRHACKIFDETKKINDEDMSYILEAGRKAPFSLLFLCVVAIGFPAVQW